MFGLTTRLARETAEELAARGLNESRAEVLFRLESGGPMVQRQLSELLRCTPRHVTGLVDDLEGVGLVERKPHPTDRRASLVTLTRKGKSTTEWMMNERRRAADILFGDVDEVKLAAFIEVMHGVLGKLQRPDTEQPE
ncbi:hypothetical protein GCM10027569_90490 [Flindersiella endophytica]